jgi:hypothetical protein
MLAVPARTVQQALKADDLMPDAIFAVNNMAGNTYGANALA